MDIRSDLSSQKFVLNPFITSQVYPIVLAGQEAGVVLAQQYKALATVETTRGNSAEPSATVDTFKNYSYDSVEAINRRIVDDRYIGFAGSKEKAQMSLSKVAGLAVMQEVETRTAKALLDSSAITNVDASVTSTTLAKEIDSVVQTLRQTPGVEKIALVCSDYVYTNLILTNTSVKDRIANPANVVFNAPTPNFKDVKMSVLAGEFQLDSVLIGSNASWYTAPTKKNYCVIMALPDPGKTQLDEVRVGITVVYDYPNAGNDMGIIVGTFYDDRKHSEVVDAWSETVAVELNPEIARVLKLA